MISRRRVLTLGVIAAAAGTYGILLSPDRRAVDVVLAKHFPDLAGTDVAEEFVADFMAAWSRLIETQTEGAMMAINWQAREMLGRPDAETAQFERVVVERFIASTMYISARDRGDEVEYLGLSFRGDGLCLNPLGAAFL